MTLDMLGVIFYSNFLIVLLGYFYVYKYRKLIGFQLGMNLSLMIGGIMAILTGILLIYQFPFQFTLVTVTSTLTGIIIGSLFGGLFDYQTLLTGYVNGLMMGIMAPMVGAAANNSMLFIGFIEGAFAVTFALLLLSVKHS